MPCLCICLHFAIMVNSCVVICICVLRTWWHIQCSKNHNFKLWIKTYFFYFYHHCFNWHSQFIPGNIRSFIRDCSDGENFFDDDWNERFRNRVKGDNQTTCIYTGTSDLACVTLCTDEHFCNGPLSGAGRNDVTMTSLSLLMTMSLLSVLRKYVVWKLLLSENLHLFVNKPLFIKVYDCVCCYRSVKIAVGSILIWHSYRLNLCQ